MFQREPTQFHNVLGVVECGWGGDRLGLHLATEEQDRSEVIEYKVYSWIKKNDLEIFDIMGKITVNQSSQLSREKVMFL